MKFKTFNYGYVAPKCDLWKMVAEDNLKAKCERITCSQIFMIIPDFALICVPKCT